MKNVDDETRRRGSRSAPRRVLLAAVGLALCGCPSSAASPPEQAAPSQPEPAAPSPAPPAADVQAVVEGTNAFALDLYGAVRNRPGNLFLSPYSVEAALAMTYAGAAGATADQMAQVLHLPSAPDRAHAAFQALLARHATTGGDDYTLRVANALWGQQGTPFRAPFLAVGRERYGAALETVDFANATEDARRTINGWVADRTEHKVPELLKEGSLDALTRLVLTNAIYFKGRWAAEFNPGKTLTRPFHLAGGGEASAPLMKQTGRFAYAEPAPGLQVLELPYQGDEVSMVVLLPKTADGLPPLEGALTAEALTGWLSALRPQKVRVYLPRFETRCALKLKAPLQQLGLTEPFDPTAADLSGIGGEPGDLYVTAVAHEAYVKVTEAGTEAAAATGVALAKRSASEDRPPTFRADRPFLFLIRERATGLILFIGRLTAPGA